MRQGGPGGRRPRSRHHGGGHNNHGGGGQGYQGGGSQGYQGGNSQGYQGRDNRPRTASSLRHQNFDSNGPDVRVRGNAWQVHEKYQTLARDAQSSGDRVAAESYLQYAEHYFRIIEVINEATLAEQRARGVTPNLTPPTMGGGQGDAPQGYYNNDPASQQQPSVDMSQGAHQMAQAEVQPRFQPVASSAPADDDTKA